MAISVSLNHRPCIKSQRDSVLFYTSISAVQLTNSLTHCKPPPSPPDTVHTHIADGTDRGRTRDKTPTTNQNHANTVVTKTTVHKPTSTGSDRLKGHRPLERASCQTKLSPQQCVTLTLHNNVIRYASTQ